MYNEFEHGRVDNRKILILSVKFSSREPEHMLRLFFQKGETTMEHMDNGTTLERRLFQIAAEKRIPLYGVLELLPLCNMNCDMCYVRLDKTEMEAQGKLRTADEWLALAKQMKKAGTLFLLLTGGEPLLYPDFRRLYLELRRMGMTVNINTNGTLIDEEWAEFFRKNKPRRINQCTVGIDVDRHPHPAKFEV